MISTVLFDTIPFFILGCITGGVVVHMIKNAQVDMSDDMIEHKHRKRMSDLRFKMSHKMYGNYPETWPRSVRNWVMEPLHTQWGPENSELSWDDWLREEGLMD